MRIIKVKLTMQDNSEFVADIFNDRNQPNGNKLRIYRLFKESVKTELYIHNNIPRSVRRTMTLFRSGTLPLAIETGRYSRPQIPLNERLCKLCYNTAAENEIHFLMNCSLYSDIRFELFQSAKCLIDRFETLTNIEKFTSIMKCGEMQSLLAHTLHKCFLRRRKFL